MTDESVFEIGKTLRRRRGRGLRNELMQLIQYAPAD